MAGLVSRNQFNIRFSPDGTKIVFVSDTINLIPGDHNFLPDIYLRNFTSSGGIVRASTNASGTETHGGDTNDTSFSPDGKSVIFTSNAYDFGFGDINNAPDVFIKNLVTGAVTWVSQTQGGANA